MGSAVIKIKKKPSCVSANACCEWINIYDVVAMQLYGFTIHLYPISLLLLLVLAHSAGKSVKQCNCVCLLQSMSNKSSIEKAARVYFV